MSEIGVGIADQHPPRDQLLQGRRRWLALMALCLGVLLTTVEITIVNVALPFIRKDLIFTETSLVWVVNAYLLTFGGSLLLSGRLGDLYGHRTLFLIGILLFTVASLGCGLARTQGELIGARAIQGVGAAAVAATALSQIAAIFASGAERAKAIGAYTFVGAGGGSIGLVLGGALTSALSWHWVFLINVPVGAAVYAWCFLVIPKGRVSSGATRLDVWGAVVGTASLILAIFVISNGRGIGWASPQIQLLLACAAIGLILFILIEAHVSAPLLPLRIFKLPDLAVTNAMAVLLTAGNSTWLFMSGLYLERVLAYGPMQVGMSFLPANVLASLLSVGLSAKIVNRFGIKRPLTFGLVPVVIAVALLIRAPLHANLWLDILPSMVLYGVGMGVAYSPLILAAIKDAGSSEEGLASGIINTSQLLGAALGLATITSLSSMRVDALLHSGKELHVALNGGYHAGFALAALSIAIAAILGIIFLRGELQAPSPAHATPKGLEP